MTHYYHKLRIIYYLRSVYVTIPIERHFHGKAQQPDMPFVQEQDAQNTSIYAGNNIVALCTSSGAGIGICPGMTMMMWLASSTTDS